MAGSRLIAIDLVAGYPKFKIRDVSLTLSSGDKMALVGKSGCGKSTLINTFLGIKDSLDGGVWFEDEDGAKNPRDVVGYSPQDNSVYPFMTIRENLHTFGKLRGMSEGEIDSRGEELLDQLDILDAIDKRVDQLSGGMRKRADIATCILHNPKLVIMDEPFTGIDPPQRDIIWGRIDKMAKNGRIVILTSHNLSMLTDHCNRYGLIQDGEYYNTEKLKQQMSQGSFRSMEEFIMEQLKK